MVMLLSLRFFDGRSSILISTAGLRSRLAVPRVRIPVSVASVAVSVVFYSDFVGVLVLALAFFESVFASVLAGVFSGEKPKKSEFGRY